MRISLALALFAVVRGQSGWFDNADSNNDLQLTVSEIAEATGRSEDQIAWWIRHQGADQDGNGAITRDEAYRLSPNYRPQGASDVTFQDLDANGDGTLTVNEIAEATGHSASSIARWIVRQQADQNGDGLIQRDEAYRLDPSYRPDRGAARPTPTPSKSAPSCIIEKPRFSGGWFMFGLAHAGTIAGAVLCKALIVSALPALGAALGRPEAPSVLTGLVGLWLFVLGCCVGAGGGYASYGWGFIVGCVASLLGHIATKAYRAAKSGVPIAGAIFGNATPTRTTPMAATDQSSVAASNFMPPVPIVIAQPGMPATQPSQD